MGHVIPVSEDRVVMKLHVLDPLHLEDFKETPNYAELRLAIQGDSMRYDVRLQHGTYVKTVSVHADDEDEAIGKAKARAKRDGFYCLSMAYESAKVVSTSE